MKDKKKLIILSSIILGVLVLTLGITYSIFTFNQTGENSQLVLGDIWMKYTENNQLTLSDAMPFDGNGYIVNPLMQKQNTGEENELYKCVNYLNDSGMPLSSDTMIEFCQGTGKASNGYTFQENLDNGDWFPDEDLAYFEENNIIIRKIENLPYFEFTISGKNTYLEKDIIYGINLALGDDVEGKNTRIKNELLRFAVVEVVDNEEKIIFNNLGYYDFTDKYIIVDKINSNDGEIKRTYRLYMWIDESTNICGGDIKDECDYYTEGDTNNWNDVFASIKVVVKGDFEEKAPTSSEMCYDYTSYVYVNPVMATQDASDETTELYKCINYLTTENIVDLENGETLEEFCRGEGTAGGNTFQEWLDRDLFIENHSKTMKDIDYFLDKNIILKDDSRIKIVNYDESCGTDVVIPEEINGASVFAIGVNVNDCCVGHYKLGAFARKGITSVVIPNSVEVINSSAFADNNIASVVIPDSVEAIGDQAFYYGGLKSLTFEENSSLTTIGEDAFRDNQLTDVEIPNSVEVINYSAFYGNKITSLTFEENSNLTTIGGSAFDGNSITSLEVPNSVTTIGSWAFSDNQLETVTIGSGIQYLDGRVFSKDSISNPKLESITFTSKTCDEIKNIQGASDDTTKYFPWLSYPSPYYQEGYKADIIGTDGVCSY